jgi:uncharacterized membrane protein
MSSILGAILTAPQLSFPGNEETAFIVMRFLHIVAGILWVGLLYFFNLVKAPALQLMDAQQRGVVITRILPKAMRWFRWSSVVTVLVGLAYWGHIVGGDAQAARAVGETPSVGRVLVSFFVIWTVAFAVEMGMVMSPAEVLRKGAVLGTVVAVVLVAASYLFLSINQQGWESNRLLCIGIGGGLGWFMMFNVWGIVWRIQKRIIRWTEDSVTKGTAIPAEAARMAQISTLCARVNFWVSFPMLFFMAAASHYPLFVGH